MIDTVLCAVLFGLFASRPRPQGGGGQAAKQAVKQVAKQADAKETGFRRRLGAAVEKSAREYARLADQGRWGELRQLAAAQLDAVEDLGLLQQLLTAAAAMGVRFTVSDVVSPPTGRLRTESVPQIRKVLLRKLDQLIAAGSVRRSGVVSDRLKTLATLFGAADALFVWYATSTSENNELIKGIPKILDGDGSPKWEVAMFGVSPTTLEFGFPWLSLLTAAFFVGAGGWTQFLLRDDTLSRLRAAQAALDKAAPEGGQKADQKVQKADQKADQKVQKGTARAAQRMLIWLECGSRADVFAVLAPNGRPLTVAQMRAVRRGKVPGRLHAQVYQNC